MIKPGRSFSSSAYKHGFNTNESDAEITGSFGNTYTAEYWMYDSRLGRRWERDPITYPWQSPYACFNNNPIYYNDVRGLEGEDVIDVKTGTGTFDDSWSSCGKGMEVFADVNSGGIKDVQLELNLLTLVATPPQSDFKGPFIFPDNTTTTNTETNSAVINQKNSIKSNSYISNDKKGTDNKEITAEQYATVGVLALSDGPEPFIMDAVAAGYFTYVWWITSGKDVAAKMQTEIEAIARKAAGPPGFTYELIATRDGEYPNRNTGGTEFLKVGDVWKYGQTTQAFGRYSQLELRRKGLEMVPIFYGNQTEILIQEKIMIYGYFLMNGHRPPGNPIFR